MIVKGYQILIEQPKHIPVRIWLPWKQRIPNHTIVQNSYQGYLCNLTRVGLSGFFSWKYATENLCCWLPKSVQLTYFRTLRWLTTVSLKHNCARWEILSDAIFFFCACNTLRHFIIKFQYNARSDWLKERALSEYRCTELSPWRHSARAGKLKTFLARACNLWKKLDFLQLKASFFTNVSKHYIIKQINKPKPCFVLW